MRVKFHADSNSVKKSVMLILASSRVSELQVWKKVVYMATNVISDMLRQKESPTISRKKVVRKDQLRYWRSIYNWVVYLKILIREKSILLESGKFGSKHAIKFSIRYLAPNHNSGKKGPIARYDPKVCASWAQCLRAELRGQITWGNLAPRKMRPQSSMVLAKNI